MDYKLKNEIKSLIKIGIPEDIAIITASANQKKDNVAKDYLDDLIIEQEELKTILSNFISFEKSIQEQTKSINH
jgi:hypothetical protein